MALLAPRRHHAVRFTVEPGERGRRRSYRASCEDCPWEARGNNPVAVQDQAAAHHRTLLLAFPEGHEAGCMCEWCAATKRALRRRELDRIINRRKAREAASN